MQNLLIERNAALPNAPLLVVPPFIISYRDAFTAALKGTAPSSKKGRNYRTNLKHWLTFLGKSLEDAIGDEFTAEYKAHLAQLSDQWLKAHPNGRNIENIRTTINAVHAAYHALLVESNLSTDFHQALTVLRLRKDLSVEALQQRHRKITATKVPAPSLKRYPRPTISAWIRGVITPHPKYFYTKTYIEALEDALEVPRTTLLSRLFKTKTPILKAAPHVEYRSHHSLLSKLPYSTALPLYITEIFEEHAAWKRKATYRINQETYYVKEGHYWTTAASEEKYHKNVRDFFSFLMLPAPTKPEHRMTDAERMTAGKGMMPGELRYTMLLDMDFMYDFLEFKRQRQVNQAYTQDSLHFLIFVNNMVNHPYSFIRSHLRFGTELDPVISDMRSWQAHCNQWHEGTKKLAKKIKEAIPKQRQRDPNEPLRAILGNAGTADPMSLLKEMVRRMYAGLAPVTNPHQRATEFRDALLFELMMEEPLRASHWGALGFDEDFIRHDDGIWELIVDKKRFKNKASPWCHDRQIRFSHDISARIDEYVGFHRPHLRGGQEKGNKRVFLSGKSGPGRKLKEGQHPYAITEATLWWAVATRFETYFQIRIGTNAFRHVLATAYLRENRCDWDGAAAILNNSPDTAKETYSHVTQADDLRRVEKWKAQKHEEFQTKLGKKSRHGQVHST